jgi:TonB family protein
MSNSNNKLLPFLIISLVIHSIIILLISNRDNHASIKILQRKPIIINLASSAPQSSQKEIAQSSKITSKQESGEQTILKKSIKQKNNTVKPSSNPIQRIDRQNQDLNPNEISAVANKENSNRSKGRSSVVNRKLESNETINQATSNPSKKKTSNQQSSNNNTNAVIKMNKEKPQRVVKCLSCPKPKYPRRALQQGVEGEPKVLITINDNGRVQSVELKRSSGNAEIDRAALEASRRSLFQAIPGGAKVPISYSIVLRGSRKHQKAVKERENQKIILNMK